MLKIMALMTMESTDEEIEELTKAGLIHNIFALRQAPLKAFLSKKHITFNH